jgi:hypothetical protein
MKNDIEELDNLHLRENRGSNLVRRFGNLWNLPKFDHSWRRSDKTQYPWVKARFIIKKFIGKNYDKAFSAYCEIVKPYEQNVFYDDFFKKEEGSTWEPEYIIDKQNRIQVNRAKLRQDAKRRADRKSRGVTFYSVDYAIGYMHKQTGVLMTVDEFKRYRSYNENKYVEVIISGFSKHFKSEKDPEYIRLNAEKIKQKALLEKTEKKEKRVKAYNFMTKAEIERKKSEAQDLIKIESHGFTDESFKGEGCHGQQRKLNKTN